NSPSTTQCYSLSLHDALPISQIRNRHTRLGLLQNRQDLAIGKSRLLHKNLLMLCYEKILLMSTLTYRGDYPPKGPSHYILRLPRSEEHTSELQSRENLVCRLL